MKLNKASSVLFAASTESAGSNGVALAEATKVVTFTESELKDDRMQVLKAFIDTKVVTVDNGQLVMNIADGDGVITTMPLDLICSITGTQILTVARRMDKDAAGKMELSGLVRKLGKDKVAELLASA